MRGGGRLEKSSGGEGELGSPWSDHFLTGR